MTIELHSHQRRNDRGLDVLDVTIEELRTDLEAERAARAQLETRFEQLSSKLQHPGTKFLVDLEYRLVSGFPKSITLAGFQHLIPGVAGVHGPFDVRYDDQHAFYLLSAKVREAGIYVVYQGSTIATTGVTVAYAAVRNGNTIETWLNLYNPTASDVTVDVKLYRRVGLK